MIYPKIPSSRLLGLALFAVTVLALASCGGGQTSQGSNSDQGQTTSENGSTAAGKSGGQKYPDVVEAKLEPSGGGAWSLSVKISSPYDSPERYADGWRVLSPDGTILGKHRLLHAHTNQQPFTPYPDRAGDPAKCPEDHRGRPRPQERLRWQHRNRSRKTRLASGLSCPRADLV